MRLLVTRPEPDNERTAHALRAFGHEVALAPLLRIETVLDADLGSAPWSAILLTSASAARAIAVHPRVRELTGLPVLAVGEASANAARAAGFVEIHSAGGDGRDLARLAAARKTGSRRPLLYLAGEHRARDLSSELSAHGLSVRTVAIYRAAKVKDFPPAVRAALLRGQIDGALHFSQRSAEAYLECGCNTVEAALAPVHYCLSARIAEPLRSAGAGRICIARRPDEDSLLALVAPQVAPKT
jgi:uroporphyrinogen-III synthase